MTNLILHGCCINKISSLNIRTSLHEQEVSYYLAKYQAAVPSLFIVLGCDRQRVCPTTFQVYLPFTNTFYRLFTACICGINPMGLGNVPSGMPGEKKISDFSFYILFVVSKFSSQRGKQNPFLTMNPPADSSKSREWGIWKYNDKLISGEHSLCSGCQTVNKACLWGQRRHQPSCLSWQLQPLVTLNSPWDCFLLSTPQPSSAPNALVKPLFACDSQFIDKGFSVHGQRFTFRPWDDEAEIPSIYYLPFSSFSIPSNT